jgi:hypothetical protein
MRGPLGSQGSIMSHEKPTAWRTYEEVAVHLLDRLAAEFGLEEVQGRPVGAGASIGHFLAS